MVGFRGVAVFVLLSDVPVADFDLGAFFFLLFRIDNRDFTHGIVGQDIEHYRRDKLLQLAYEVGSAVIATFDAAQLVLPQTGQFGAFQQFFVDQGYEVDTGLCGHYVFALTGYVMAVEQRFDYGCSGGGTADAVLLHCVAQLLVVHGFTGRFHGTQQGSFGVKLRGLGGAFLQRRVVWSAFAGSKRRQYAVGVAVLRFSFAGGVCLFCRKRRAIPAR